MMTNEDRHMVLSHIQKLEFNGHVSLAHVLRSVLVEADKVPDLEATIADLRTPMQVGGTE